MYPPIFLKIYLIQIYAKLSPSMKKRANGLFAVTKQIAGVNFPLNYPTNMRVCLKNQTAQGLY